MARYNTVTPVASTTTTSTISSPTQGLLNTLAGTGPYTVTLASPVLFTGISQNFWNNTGSSITLSSPSGNIRGPGFTAAASQTIPNQAVFALTSDGTDYVVTNNEGGPQVGSTMVLSSLTSGRVTYATTNGQLTDSSNLTFNGTTLTVNTFAVSNNTTVGGTLGVTSNATVGGTLGITGVTTISSSASSSSTSNGALIVSGGAGIAGNINNGGNITSSGNGTFSGTMAVNSTSGASSYTSGALTVAGGVGINGALYVNSVINCGNDITAWYSSDRDLKEKVTPIPDALNKIAKIGGYTFDWNAKALEMYPDRKVNDIGVIAQEVQEVQPLAVIKRDNGFLAVNYEKLIPLLIQGIKELQAEVADLKAKIGE
jgi:hypothetical protein